MARRVKTDAEYDDAIRKAEERVKALKKQRRKAEEERKGEVNVIIIQKLHEWNDARQNPSEWDEDFAEEIISMLTVQEEFQHRKKAHHQADDFPKPKDMVF